MAKLTFEQMMTPGRKVRIFYNKGHFANRTIHIRSIVDEDVVVFAYWRKHYFWAYDIYYKEWLKMLFDRGNLISKGKSQFTLEKE